MEKDRKFIGYIEYEWLEHKANMKCFSRPIKHFDLRHFPKSTVLYLFEQPNTYPDTYIKTSLN